MCLLMLGRNSGSKPEERLINYYSTKAMFESLSFYKKLVFSNSLISKNWFIKKILGEDIWRPVFKS
jgi:hypothetical protein